MPGPANTGLAYRYTYQNCPGHEYQGKYNEGHCSLIWKCGKCSDNTTKIWQCKHCGFLMCNMCKQYSRSATGTISKDQPRYYGR